jgi:plasmid stabilization system protein ParE
MKVVWSDDAVWALVALETRLAQRYSADKAARIVGDLVRRVDRLEDHPQLGRAVPEYGPWQLRELVGGAKDAVHRPARARPGLVERDPRDAGREQDRQDRVADRLHEGLEARQAVRVRHDRDEHRGCDGADPQGVTDEQRARAVIADRDRDERTKASASARVIVDRYNHCGFTPRAWITKRAIAEIAISAMHAQARPRAPSLAAASGHPR